MSPQEHEATDAQERIHRDPLYHAWSRCRRAGTTRAQGGLRTQAGGERRSARGPISSGYIDWACQRVKVA